MKNISLKYKLLVIILFTSFLSVIVVSFCVYAFSSKSLRNQLEKDVNLKAYLIAESLEGAIAFEDTPRIESILQSFSMQPNLTLVCLYNPHSALIHNYTQKNAKISCPYSVKEAANSWGHNYYALQQRIQPRDVFLGSLLMVADTQPVTDYSKNFQKAVLFLSLAVLFVISFPLAAVLQKIIYDPIRKLVFESNQLPESISKRFLINRTIRKDEIIELEYKINLFKKYFIEFFEVRELETLENQTSQKNTLISLKFLQTKSELLRQSSEAAYQFSEEKTSAISSSNMKTLKEVLKINSELSHDMNFSCSEIKAKTIDSFIKTKSFIKRKVDFENTFLTSFSKVFGKNISNLHLYLDFKNEETSTLVFDLDVFNQMMESVFKLYHAILITGLCYEFHIDVSSISNNTVITINSIVSNKIDSLKHGYDVDNAKADLPLFFCKYYYNCLMTELNDAGFRLDFLSNDEAQITIIL